MNINQYFDQTQNFQGLILDFFENDAFIEDDLPKWNKIFDSKNKLEPIMHLILSISNDDQHVLDFFQKIGKILLFFREQMMILFLKIVSIYIILLTSQVTSMKSLFFITLANIIISFL